jgi:CHASE2 domain-containing sensor protein/two-component sensor histidine kinase
MRFSLIRAPGPSALRRDGLLFQRLTWGAAAGGLATILLAESPVLDTMEMNLLEWRYKTGYELARTLKYVAPVFGGGASEESRAQDIAILTYDDDDQFDLEGEAVEGGPQPVQAVLAKLIPIVESGSPLLIVLDIDLSGKADPTLVKTLKKYRNNIVLALSGNLDNPNDFPSSELRKSVLTCAYDHLIKETSGLVCRMPISANIFMPTDRAEGTEAARAHIPETGMSPALEILPQGLVEYTRGLSASGEAFESLPEVVAPLMSARVGVGPSKQQISSFSKEELPIYIKFSGTKYPTYKISQIIRDAIDPGVFAGKVVMIGTNFSQKIDNTPPVRTPLQAKAPNVLIQAEAINTLHNNEAIVSFPRSILHHVLLLLGAALGTVASALPMGRRTAAFLSTAMVLMLLTQIAFQWFNIQFPVLPLLAVLMLTYIFGTLIYLDTDLRLRNKELALARENMQVRAEEERQRIAEDLHDETLPALSSVARMADRLANAPEMIDNPVPLEMREKLDGAISEMRRVINDLHPSVLETMGFKPALENLLAILAREKHIHVDFVDSDDQDDYGFNKFIRLQLYRIVQESLNNVQKHARANTVKLAIGKEGDNLVITITDNGRGIDFNSIRKDAHGLVNIRQRAQLIGAQVDWRKPDGFDSGTQVTLAIPLPETRNDGLPQIQLSNSKKG